RGVAAPAASADVAPLGGRIRSHRAAMERGRCDLVEPPAPRPAATVILLRRGGKHADIGLQVLLVRRNPEARFMPGVWVFPGGAVDSADGDGEQAHRAAAVRGLAEGAAVGLDAEEVVADARWITPTAVPTRSDTRFSLAVAPPHAPPKPDGSETVEAGWFRPQEALDRHQAGELPLVFPTIKPLESLVGYADSDEALEAARR